MTTREKKTSAVPTTGPDGHILPLKTILDSAVDEAVHRSGKTISAIARQMKVSRTTLYLFMNNRPEITAADPETEVVEKWETPTWTHVRLHDQNRCAAAAGHRPGSLSR